MRPCPRCRSPLTDFEIEPGSARGTVVDFCPSCRGVWCDAGELSEVLGAPPGRPASLPSPENSLADTIPCPACEGSLLTTVREEGPAWRECSHCRGAWIEGGDLPALRAAARARAVEARRRDRRGSNAPADRPPALDDRLSFDTPWADLLALPAALLAGLLVGVAGFGAVLLIPLQIWIHELGHALPAWLSGRAALPLPFGFTFWREEPSWFTAGCVLFLIGVIGAAGWRERKPFPLALAGVLLGLQVLCTFVLAPDVTVEWIVFGGLAGEMILSAAAVIAFHHQAPDRFRWDFWRWVVLIPAACVLVSALWLWVRVDAEPGLLPRGSILGTRGDGTGDVDRLLGDHGWTAESLGDAYLTIASICLAVVLAHYAWFAVRACRRLRRGR